MTIETLVRKVQYTGDDNQVEFQFPYPIQEDTDLTVILTDLNGVETTQVLNTNYSIPISGSFDDGGTVEMFIAPPLNNLLTLERVMPLTQESDYIEGDAFPAEIHEDALDKGIMIDQQLQDTINLCIKIPTSDTNITVELPTSSLRSDTILIFDSNGNVDVSTLSALLSGGGNHDLLQNLGTSSHTAYLLIDGTRAMTGNLDMNSKDISNINQATVVEQLVIPLDEPTSLVNGSIWIS